MIRPLAWLLERSSSRVVEGGRRSRGTPIQVPEELAIKAVTFNGQIYGVPFTMNNIVLFRNTDLAPDAPSSIEDLVATGKKLKASGR
jgi:hypothetical protein